MALVKAVDLSNPVADDIGSDEADIFRKELRFRATEPVSDAIKSTTFSVSGGDVTVDYESRQALGTKVKANLKKWDHTVLASGTSTAVSGTITFTNADTDAVLSSVFVINGSGNRVSERVTGQLTEDDLTTSLLTGNKIGHPSLPDYVDPGSEYDVRLKQRSDDDLRQSDLQDVESTVDKIYDRHHEFQYNGIKAVERHVDLIAGGIDVYSDDPLQDSDYSTTKETGPASDLLRIDRPDWLMGTDSQDFSKGEGTVQFYDSPGGSRTSGDDSEKKELQDAIDNSNFPTTIYDETAEQDVTYNNSTEAQDRIDEIETIIDDFNSSTTLQNMFVDRADLIDVQANRVNGFALEANMMTDSKDVQKVETDIMDIIEGEAGLE